MVCARSSVTHKLVCALGIPFLAGIVLRAFLCGCAAQGTSFVFNDFDDDDTRAKISCFQSASFQDKTLQLTATGAVQATGRCLYNTPIRLLAPGTRSPLSFSTQFIFYIQPSTNTDLADGVAFVIAPSLSGVVNSSQGYIGIFNSDTNGNVSTQTLAIEFDTYKNPEFEDIDDNHVGVDVNDIVSWAVTSAAVRTSSSPTIRSAEDGYAVQMKAAYVQAWIDYDSTTNHLNVSLSRGLGRKPAFPLISNDSLDLAGLFNESMYVGFTASTGPLPTVLYNVYAWSFRSEEGLAANISLSSGNSGHKTAKTAIALTISFVGLFVIMVLVLYYFVRKKRLRIRNSKRQEWKISLQEQLPQEFSYRDLQKATNYFNVKNHLGSGGFGEVFKGVLPDSGAPVAVKKLSKGSRQGAKEFVSEVTTIGRLRHRNLVPLLGWCQEKDFMLVYELMPHGSLDSLLPDDQHILSWDKRLHILQGVAAALLYLHEGCEQKIIHRDIKSSNVMLDAQMNARLGDFGLARLYGHGVVSETTNVAGTWGYMAPEMFFTRKATEKTDVFSFGSLTLEVATGKRLSDAREEEDCSVIEWLWKLRSRNALREAFGTALFSDDQELPDMVAVVFELGFLCCSSDPESRPSMRHVVQVLAGDAPVPPLPTALASTSLLSSFSLASDSTSLLSHFQSDNSRSSQ